MSPISPCRSILDDSDTCPEGSFGFVIFIDALGDYYFSDELSDSEPLLLGPYQSHEYYEHWDMCFDALRDSLPLLDVYEWEDYWVPSAV